MPQSDKPETVNFSRDDAEALRRLQAELVRRFGSTRAAAAANLLAISNALARGITPEQHGLELEQARRVLEGAAAGGGQG